VILAELGIQRKSKPYLLQAEEFFARAAVKPGRYNDHFNLANVLADLDDKAGAEKHYLKAVELNPRHAQSWKNLGTLYTHLGDPEKGMKCFDTALEIEPQLVEAHLSKANNWLMFFDQPQEAVKGFQAALAIEPDLDRRWRHYRYWYSRALLEAGQTEAALIEADAGLRLHPDNRPLLDLKAEIFSRLWPADPRFIVPAQAYFRFRLRCFERDFEALRELMKIHEARKMPELSWQFIESNLDGGRSRLRTISAWAGLGLADWQSGLKAVGNYRLFRERYPTRDYCDALRPHGLNPEPNLPAALSIALLPVFGRAQARLAGCTKTERHWEAVKAANEIGRQVAKVMTWFGTDWLAPAMPENTEERIDRLSRGLLSIPDLVVMEGSRIFAIIGLHQDLPIQKLSERAKWVDCHRDCIGLLLERIIEPWQMRKKPEEKK
jgi:tetratricopeptide (TPR) repeat protein